MPFLIPFLLGGGALALAMFGLSRAKAGRKAIADARALLAEAQARHTDACAALERAREATNRRAGAYADQKLAHLRGPVARTIGFLEAIEHRGTAAEVRALRALRVSLPDRPAAAGSPIEARDALKQLVAVAGTGAAAGQLAWASALLGTASTGAAISGLSGAAATSATLAWLGGGALTVGGGGMALGRVVLGGVAFGPALALAGLLVERQGSVTLTRAREAAARTNIAIGEIGVARAALDGVVRRIDELSGLAEALASRLDAALDGLDPARWSAEVDADVNALQRMLMLAMALGKVLRTPVIDDVGSLTSASVEVQLEFQDLIR